jgi:dTDP-glucose pyrophosphorylase
MDARSYFTRQIIGVDKVSDPNDYGIVSFRFRPEKKKIMKAHNRTAARHSEIFWEKTA